MRRAAKSLHREPSCVINPSSNTIPAHITIYGAADSTAQRYAAANGNPFAVLQEGTHIHTYAITGKEPTCTEDGVRVYTCTVCNEGYTEQLAKLGHEDFNADHVCDHCGQTLCKYCGQVHTGGWGKVVAFFHEILYRIRLLFQR